MARRLGGSRTLPKESNGTNHRLSSCRSTESYWCGMRHTSGYLLLPPPGPELQVKGQTTATLSPATTPQDARRAGRQPPVRIRSVLGGPFYSERSRRVATTHGQVSILGSGSFLLLCRHPHRLGLDRVRPSPILLQVVVLQGGGSVRSAVTFYDEQMKIVRFLSVHVQTHR